MMALLQARGALWLLPDPEWVVAGFAFFMMLFAFENLSLHEDIRELRAKCDTEQCTTNASVLNEILYQNFILNREKANLQRLLPQPRTSRGQIRHSRTSVSSLSL